MKKYCVLFLLAASIVSTPAAALEAFFIGVEGGAARTDYNFQSFFTPDDTFSDGDDRVIGAYAGLTMTKLFALEVAYTDLGTSSLTYVQILPPFPPPAPSTPARAESRTTFESESASVSVLGRYEFATGLALVERAGVASHRYESNLRAWYNGRPVPIRGVSEDSGSLSAVVLGGGIEWSMHRDWALRMQVQRHFVGDEGKDIDRGDVTAITGGIEYRF